MDPAAGAAVPATPDSTEDEDDVAMTSSVRNAGDPDSLDLALMEMELPTRGAHFRCTTTSNANSSDAPSFHPEGYVGSGELDRTARGQTPTPHLAGSSVSLFGCEWPMSGLLGRRHQRTLFSLFLQRMSAVEASAATRKDRAGGGAPSWRDAVEQARDFLAYVRHVSYHYATYSAQVVSAAIGSGGDGGDHYEREDCLSRLVDWLHLVHLHVGRLPVAASDGSIVVGSSADDGYSFAAATEDTDPRTCHHHLLLDCRWTLYSAVRSLAGRPGGSLAREAAGSLARRKFVEMKGLATGTLPPLAMEEGPLAAVRRELTLQLAADLLAASERLAKRRGSAKMASTSPFPCGCVRELWLLLMKSDEADFWEVLLAVVGFVVASPPDRNAVPTTGIVSGDCLEVDLSELGNSRTYLWWVLGSLASLSRLDARGERATGGTEAKEHREAVWKVANSLLRCTLDQSANGNNRGGVWEEEVRTTVVFVAAVTKSVGPNLPCLTALWENFFKRLNSAFVDRADAANLNGLQVLPKSLSAWLKTDGRSGSAADAFAGKNSFDLFLSLLRQSLTEGDGGGDDEAETAKSKMRLKLAGRIKAKLSPAKAGELREIGWFHLFRLFAEILRCCGSKRDEANKWTEFAAGLVNNAAQGNFRLAHVKAMGMGALTIRCAEAGSDPSPSLGAFMKRLNQSIREVLSCSDVKDRKAREEECQRCVVAFSDLVQESLRVRGVAGRLEILNRSCVVSPWFGKYLKVCGGSEMGRLFSVLVSVTTKLRKFLKASSDGGGGGCMTEEERSAREEVERTQEALWRDIFPVLEQDLCSSATAAAVPELAELCSAMVMLAMENPPAASSSTSKPSEKLFEFFAVSPSVRPALSCQFLLNFMEQGGQRVRRLQFTLGKTDDIIVRGWLRCGVASAVDGDALRPTLSHLSKKVFELEDMADLLPHLDKDWEDQNGPEAFFAALGRLHGERAAVADGSAATLEDKFVPLLSECVENMTTKRSQAKNRAQMPGLYRMAGRLVESCSRLLYSRSRSMNLINPLLMDLFTFAEIRHPSKFCPPQNFLDLVAASLPRVVAGLGEVESFRADSFVLRSLKDLYVTYMPRYPPDKNHPLCSVFASSRHWRRGTESHLFSVLKAEFLSAPDRDRKQKALAFMLEALKMDRSDAFASRFCRAFCRPVAEIWVSAQNDEKSRKVCSDLLAEMVAANKKRRMATAGVEEEVAPHLRELIKSNTFSFSSSEVLGLLERVALLDGDMVKGLCPLLEEQVVAVQTKRGTAPGRDSRLQVALGNLKKKLR